MRRNRKQPSEPADLREAIDDLGRIRPYPPPAPLEAGGDWRAWLRDLNESIWEVHLPPPLSRGGFTFTRESRRLTGEEWATVLRVLEEHRPEVICEAHNACMGFGCGMRLYEVPPHVYPDATTEPEYLVGLTQDHLPVAEGAREPRFEEAWAVFSPHTHDAGNARLLVAHGFKAPEAKSAYEY